MTPQGKIILFPGARVLYPQGPPTPTVRFRPWKRRPADQLSLPLPDTRELDALIQVARNASADAQKKADEALDERERRFWAGQVARCDEAIEKLLARKAATATQQTLPGTGPSPS